MSRKQLGLWMENLSDFTIKEDLKHQIIIKNQKELHYILQFFEFSNQDFITSEWKKNVNKKLLRLFHRYDK